MVGHRCKHVASLGGGATLMGRHWRYMEWAEGEMRGRCMGKGRGYIYGEGAVQCINGKS